MLIKSASIEIQRSSKQAFVVGLHQGTVNSRLSKPFQAQVPECMLFTPEKSVQSLLSVLNHLNEGDSGKCFAWDGKEVELHTIVIYWFK